MSRRKLLNFTRKPKKKTRTKADFIKAESELGRTLFGPIPEGHHREFFNHKHNVWIWHDCWTDKEGKHHDTTIRYEVRPSGVFKRVGRSAYKEIKGAELSNFRQATHAYLRIIKQKLYNKA